jgi:enoyl-CoA hydratase
LLCDIIIVRDDAKLADPHVKVGLVAGDGGSIIWPALIGYARAKRYLFTGDTISGAEAAKIGLASESCPAGELDARVHAIAHRLAGGATAAIRLTKKAVNMDLRQRLDSLLEAHLGYETMSHLTADHREALDAFLNKRAPVFSGK